MRRAMDIAKHRFPQQGRGRTRQRGRPSWWH
jgi:type II secretory ATPase GspE/PulE/Tfp pilus assembly ATPase PilB-like protein